MGSVSSNAHVDAVGYSLSPENFTVGLTSNPIGGGYSAPVKKVRISFKVTSQFSLSVKKI